MSLPDWVNLVLGSLLVVLATARLLVAIVKLLRELLTHAGGLPIDLAQLWRSDVVRLSTAAAIAAMVGMIVGTSMAKSTTRPLREITAPPFSREHGRSNSSRGSTPDRTQPPSMEGGQSGDTVISWRQQTYSGSSDRRLGIDLACPKPSTSGRCRTHDLIDRACRRHAERPNASEFALSGTMLAASRCAHD